jgi:signal transduction histidine kinase
MSDTASSRIEHVPFLAWVGIAVVNTALMFMLPGAETVPFHVVWVSMVVAYGVRPWPLPATYGVLVVVGVVTGAALVLHARSGRIGWEETTEVPMMSLVFLAMVWHVRRRTAALAEARRHAEGERRMRDAQKRFVRFASHELRTPVTVARGYTELIREVRSTPQIAEDAAIVLDELDKLERIAGRLLALAQLDQHATLAPQPTDLDALLHRTLQRWRAAAPRLWAIQADAGTVQADPERLQTALDSLVENAVRHTGPGGRIWLTGRREGASAVIEVRDGGSGIAQEDINFVFESFRSGAGGGTGMGLAIVKAIVEGHGGSALAANSDGGGAVFTLRLPVQGPAREVPVPG